MFRNDPLDRPITEYFAWVLVDANGNEGIPAGLIGGLAYPLMGKNRSLVDKMKRLALDAQHLSGHTLKLIRLSSVEIIETIAGSENHAP